MPLTDELERVRQKQLQEMVALAAHASVTVTGLIFPFGASGAHTPGDEFWLLSFSCFAWRTDGRSIRREALLVRRWASNAELRAFMDRHKSGAIVEMRVRLAKSGFDQPLALLEDLTTADSADAQLHAILDDLRKSVVHVDEQFGVLTLDRVMGWFEGRVDWNGANVTLYVVADQPGDLDKSLVAARSLWSRQAGWTRQVNDIAVAKLLSLKNETWLEAGESASTPAAFVERMVLESIKIDPHGRFEFVHDDGDLFWGHGIEVSGTLAQGAHEVGIVG
jgi:hypothetical protein